MPTVFNHASGSANPASSLPALWAYLQPALDHIIKSPTDDPNGKAPAIDINLYAGIHSACYNYFTAQSEATSLNSTGNNDDRQVPASGADIYIQLEKYFEEAAQELALGAPLDDISLIRYIVPSFKRYHAGAQSANRLLNYVNRHYVKRAVDEDRGWCRVADVVESITKNVPNEDKREFFSEKFRDRRTDELKKWGYKEGDTSEQAAFSESCAEAASSLDRVVPIASLAHRRFRTEFIEPLLVSPKIKVRLKAKKKFPRPSLGLNPARPRGRLSRAIHDLLESDAVEKEERLSLASGLAVMLPLIGVRKDHMLRRKLDKFVAAAT